MRFRRKGKNWEDRAWETTPALNALLDEVEEWEPEPRPLDGTVASRGHDQANPLSDHRPTPYSGFGWVRAVDVGEVGPEGDELSEFLRDARDKRTKYVIHKRRIFFGSEYPYLRDRQPWRWFTYNGANAHLDHVHISLLGDDADASAWGLMSATTKGIQKNLNKSGFRDADGNKLTVDGIWGDKTEYADLQSKLAAAAVGDFITKTQADRRYAKDDHGHTATTKID